VVAAGRGSRLGGGLLKQYRLLGGVPMVLRSLRPFTAHPEVLQVVLVLPPADAAAPPAFLRELIGERLRLVAGGAERADSVAAGLAALDPRCTVVLVHDAARPFVERGVIDAVIGHARAGEGAVAAVRVSDTLKQVAPADPMRVVRTVPRDGLWRAQTPQMFRYDLLRRGLENTPDATDEAQAVESVGYSAPRLVQGETTNIKVTFAEDLQLAEMILRLQGRVT